MIELLRALFLLEMIARVAGRRKPDEPYLLGLTAAEPVTDFERCLYDAMDDQQ